MQVDILVVSFNLENLEVVCWLASYEAELVRHVMLHRGLGSGKVLIMEPAIATIGFLRFDSAPSSPSKILLLSNALSLIRKILQKISKNNREI